MPRILFGTLITRPAASAVPLGTIYVDTTQNVYLCAPVGGIHTWISGGGSGAGLSDKYFVNAPGSIPGVGYTSISDALVAALADGHNTANPAAIFVYPGTYTGFTAIAGISIVGMGADPLDVTVVGNVLVTALAGVVSLKNFTISGSVLVSAGAPSTAVFIANDVIINSVTPGFPAFDIAAATTGFSVNFERCFLDSNTSLEHAFNADGSCSLTAVDTEFDAKAPHNVLSLAGGSLSLKRCTLNGQHSTFLAAVAAELTDVRFNLEPAAIAVFQGFAGSTANIHGWIDIQNLAAAGDFFAVAGVVNADPGVFIGTYQIAHLPPVATQFVLAAASDGTKVGGGPTGVPVYSDGGGVWLTYQDIPPV